jgi:hypothetical protein
MAKRSLAAIAVAVLVMGAALALTPSASSASSAEPSRPQSESHVVAEAQQYPPQQNFFSFRFSLDLLFLRLEITVVLGSFLRDSQVLVESRRLGVRDVVTAGADGTAVLDAAIPDDAKPGRYTLTATGTSENGPLRVTSTVDVPTKAERAAAAADVLERPITAAGLTALGQGVILPVSTETAGAETAGAETDVGELPRTGAGGGAEAAARVGALLLACGGLLLTAARRRRAQRLQSLR